ncbi:DUF5366 family protein [Niallia nealsonii]|uniref:Uncharacterized protein n=1 Tax=Niallia nealsonii TaxID=115979 RepID=A0A2N0Z2B1_9BACI|nr:DUF5366 family protein [Niallia nealsonii]PKG23641.1 hypothetical protein CWS01_11685 [Niallia nealsonii]
MNNTYITSYFPLFSISLFSLAFAMKAEKALLSFFKEIGVYKGLLEFFTETSIKLVMLLVLAGCFFMGLAVLKLMADTINELSLLFFSADSTGESLIKAKKGSIIYFIGSIISLFCIFHSMVLIGTFVLTALVYFIYFVNAASASLSFTGIVFIIFFQVLTWAFLLTTLVFFCLKLYNMVLKNLPI